MLAIRVKERGVVPRGMKKAFNAASKKAWKDVALRFHSEFRDKRFTVEHAEEAKYAKRKGERLSRDSAAYRRSYTGRKERLHGHTRPLEFTGETRRKVKSATVTSTSKGGKASYRGASKFNFRHPRSRVRMNEEFTRLTKKEAIELGEYYDRRLDFHLQQQDER